MNYQEELAKVENDRVALRAWQTEFSPSIVRQVEEHLAGTHWTKNPSPGEKKEVDVYWAEKRKKLADSNYHIIARAMLVDPGRGTVDNYKALLQVAIKLSEKPAKKTLWQKFFGGSDLDKIDKQLAEARELAQGIVNSAFF